MSTNNTGKSNKNGGIFLEHSLIPPHSNGGKGGSGGKNEGSNGNKIVKNSGGGKK